MVMRTFRENMMRLNEVIGVYEKSDFHSFRHTHATELSEAGVNIKEIQRRLGHSTMNVTSKRYLHATKAMEEESVEKMNRMFGS